MPFVSPSIHPYFRATAINAERQQILWRNATNRKIKEKVTYADDITLIAADNEDIAEATKTVNQFSDGTQFQINEDKTKLFHHFEKRSERRLNVLGMYLQNVKISQKECYKQMLENENQKVGRVCRTTRSMKVKSDILKTFVMPSIVFFAKTTSCDRRTWQSLQKTLLNALHNKQNNQLFQRLLFGNTCKGGVGFPCLKSYLLESYLLDVCRAIFCKDDTFLQTAIADALKDEQNCVHKKLKQLKILPRITSLHMTRDYFHVMTEQGSKALPINAKEIYKFAKFSQHGNFWNERIRKAADRHEVTTITLVQKQRAVWKDIYLNPTQRGVFHKFSVHLCREGFFKNAGYNAVETCYLCKKDSQAYKQLFLKVKKLQQGQINWDSLQQKIYLQRVWRINGPQLNTRQPL